MNPELLSYDHIKIAEVLFPDKPRKQSIENMRQCKNVYKDKGKGIWSVYVEAYRFRTEPTLAFDTLKKLLKVCSEFNYLDMKEHLGMGEEGSENMNEIKLQLAFFTRDPLEYLVKNNETALYEKLLAKSMS